MIATALSILIVCGIVLLFIAGWTDWCRREDDKYSWMSPDEDDNDYDGSNLK